MNLPIIEPLTPEEENVARELGLPTNLEDWDDESVKIAQERLHNLCVQTSGSWLNDPVRHEVADRLTIYWGVKDLQKERE